MNKTSSENLFRRAAEAENGTPISVGARVAHVRLAIESGRAIVVDLTGVPDENRTALVAEIKELVHKASVRASRAEAKSAGETA
jgi:hypothetical protein